ncbi:hypothetical protein BMS3Abin17_00057 [archaeon BMS3Abin17]|nr:hypothetical protein BMS3Abin17_00057 [archaeon BMS3Abin17]
MVKIYKKAKRFIPIERINTNIKYYTPKKNNIKLFWLVGFGLVLIITPFSNWLMIPTFKLLGKFPLWIYK